MSGSDLSSWAVIEGTQHPQEYARRLAKVVGCEDIPGEGMINCLRSKEPMELVYAAEKVSTNVSLLCVTRNNRYLCNEETKCIYWKITVT